MPDFLERRRMARMIDRTAERMVDVTMPEKGWITTVRRALGMPAEYVAVRKGVSRNAVYQAERSEIEGSISIKQMENLAAAMDARFVYAIVPNDRVENLKYKQAVCKARAEIGGVKEAGNWPADTRQDWIEDRAAELLHDMPSDFWTKK